MKRFSRYSCCLVLIAIFLAGCMTSPYKRYFQLKLPVGESKGLTPIDRVLLVKRVKVERIYDDYRLVYRESPFELNYYSYSFWIKKPGELIRDAVVEFLEKNNVFKRVIRQFSQGTPQWTMQARVLTLEEVDAIRKWYARLAMEIEIREFESNRLILLHTFNRTEALKDKKTYLVPMGLSHILHEELVKVIGKLKLNK
jgi:ABC-type uncharacterized transport system auxiliary subunit